MLLVSGVAVRLGLAVHPSLTCTCSAVQLPLLQLMPAVLLCGVQSFGAGAIAVLHSVLDFPSGSNRREPEGRKEGSNRVFVRVGCLVPVCVWVFACRCSCLALLQDGSSLKCRVLVGGGLQMLSCAALPS